MLLRERLETLSLSSVADEVTVHFPWGSLLRGALAEDQRVFGAMCGLPRVGGVLTLLFSVTARDGRAPLSDRDIARMVRAYRVAGFEIVEDRAAARNDVDAARSTWGKRLDVGGTRPGRLLQLVRVSAEV
jgi:16S rRNA (adenine(1408)-N(1))-methyltransferase